MTGALAAAIALLASAPPPGAPAGDELPAGPGEALVREKCIGCHGPDYLTQQRLTAPQWQRTVEKMRKLGAELTDEEAKVASDYLARGWPAAAPDRRPAPVPAPAGAVPQR